MVDVVRFGLTYVAQRPECHPLVEAVISDARCRNFRTAGGALAYTTRKLREAGLTVATPCSGVSVPVRRPARFSWSGGGTAA